VLKRKRSQKEKLRQSEGKERKNIPKNGWKTGPRTCRNRGERAQVTVPHKGKKRKTIMEH